MADGSTISVIGALIGNLAVAAVKAFAFTVSGSSAMLTEAIHSLVDSLNQLLLLFGLHQGRKPADESHPFGHGLEAYFWTFIVALLIFAVGGAIGIWEGLHKFAHPARVTHAWLNLGVIAVSGVIEVLSLAVSLNAARRTPSPLLRRIVLSFVQLMHESKDPGIYEALAENSAAVLGLAFAALGVVGSAWFGWPHADAIASLAIGALLVGVAIYLAVETPQPAHRRGGLAACAGRNPAHLRRRQARAGGVRDPEHAPGPAGYPGGRDAGLPRRPDRAGARSRRRRADRPAQGGRAAHHPGVHPPGPGRLFYARRLS